MQRFLGKGAKIQRNGPGNFRGLPQSHHRTHQLQKIYGKQTETIEIVNLEGKLVYRTTLLPGIDTVQISTVPWSKGIYLLKYNDFHQKIEVK